MTCLLTSQGAGSQPDVHNMSSQGAGSQPDVDNMPYEELSALVERIGDFSIGLNKYELSYAVRPCMAVPFLKPTPKTGDECCICEELYAANSDMCRLRCQHHFHSPCLSRWLKIKNECPICRREALSSEDRSLLARINYQQLEEYCADLEEEEDEED